MFIKCITSQHMKACQKLFAKTLVDSFYSEIRSFCINYTVYKLIATNVYESLSVLQFCTSVLFLKTSRIQQLKEGLE